MKRVKFVRSAGVYAKGAIASFPDGEAELAVNKGDAEFYDEIEHVAAAVPQSTRERVIFLKNFKHDAQEWPRDARAVIPASIAAIAIRGGFAKPFPIRSVGGDNKMVSTATVK